MLAALRRDFRLAPLTFLLLAGSALLFFAVEFSQRREADPMNSGHRGFGAVSTLALVADHEIHGPFDLWDGPWWRWWRIPMSALHHVNLLHLICNISFLWYLGPMLERRLRWWRYLIFLFFAALVPLLPEFLMEQAAIGLSGVGCAMFGWCLVERDFDRDVAARVPDDFVKYTWIFLFGCIVTTVLNILPVANVAHFAGVGYGWLIGRSGRVRAWRIATRLGHAIVVPLAVWLTLHPFWNARYHAYAGLHAETDKNAVASERHFREAIRIDPGLALPWHGLAIAMLRDDKKLDAWRLAIDGLKANRSSEKLAELVQHLWRVLPRDDRAAGRQHFDNAFAADAETWSKRLKLAEPASVSTDVSDLFKNLFPGQTDESLELETPPVPNPKRRLRPVNPDQRDSASEGELL